VRGRTPACPPNETLPGGVRLAALTAALDVSVDELIGGNPRCHRSRWTCQRALLGVGKENCLATYPKAIRDEMLRIGRAWAPLENRGGGATQTGERSAADEAPLYFAAVGKPGPLVYKPGP
jgi:hypothetical protein